MCYYNSNKHKNCVFYGASSFCIEIKFQCISKADPRGAQGARAPHLAPLIIYSSLNNFFIFTTLVHLRETLSYYVDLPLKLSFRSLRAYTTVFYPVFSNANNHELFSCAPPPFREILDPPVHLAKPSLRKRPFF